MISFLMPSRKRSELAKKSIESLGNGDFEVLICVDEDDNDPGYAEVAKMPRVRLFETPRYGYRELHKYYNFMAEKAKGDWLFLWNDDATMDVTNWEEKIKQFDPNKPMVLDPYHGVGNLFPILSRKFYEIIGHYSLSPHADSWPEDVASRAGVMFPVGGIMISHIGEAMFDETHNLVREIVRITSPQFYEPHMVKLREEEAAKIIAYKEAE